MFRILQVDKVIYAKSGSKPAKDFVTASKDQQYLTSSKTPVPDTHNLLTDTFFSRIRVDYKRLHFHQILKTKFNVIATGINDKSAAHKQ